MEISIICEDFNKRKEYIEYITHHCVGVEELPMKVMLSLEKQKTIAEGLASTENRKPLEGLVVDGQETVTKEERRGGELLEDEIIEAEGLKIDIAARRVWVRGEECYLTPVEYDILTFLAKRSNRVVTKEELCLGIGRKSVGNYAKSLPIHIRNLRKKIELDCSFPIYIETIRGVGFRFNR